METWASVECLPKYLARATKSCLEARSAAHITLYKWNFTAVRLPCPKLKSFSSPFQTSFPQRRIWVTYSSQRLPL